MSDIHYSVHVQITRVEKTSDRTEYNNGSRREVKGDRLVNEIFDLRLSAETKEQALKRAARLIAVHMEGGDD